MALGLGADASTWGLHCIYLAWLEEWQYTRVKLSIFVLHFGLGDSFERLRSIIP